MFTYLDYPNAQSISFQINKIPGSLGNFTVPQGLLLGDVFVGPQFQPEYLLPEWGWYAFVDTGAAGMVQFPDYPQVTLGVTKEIDGPNAPGTHSWVIKGKPTAIGNLSKPANDLPIDNLESDDFGNRLDASGVWTGVDLGPLKVGDVVMLAVRPKTKSAPGGVWFGKNGQWKGMQPGGTPDAVLDDPTVIDKRLGYVPICGAQWGHTQLRFRYGASVLYSLPAGFEYYGETAINIPAL